MGLNMFKIRTKKMPELVNGRVKRTGRTYYEVCYWAGVGWLYKEFDTRQQAVEFTKALA